MSSHGQRFRRRAVRRGYKVDEVDTFLDRVEATLNGASIGPDVRSQEVRDVVFRVRFGGYDEWQVDLHLDRVERQLAELEERPAQPGRGAELRASLGGPPPPAPAPVPDRMGPPPPPLPTRTPAANAPTGALPRYEPRFDEQPSYAAQAQPQQPAPAGPGPQGSFDGFGGGHGRADMTSEIRMERPQPPRMQEPPRNEPPRVDPYGPSSGFGSVTAQQPVYGAPQRGGYDNDATNTFNAVPPASANAPAYGGGGGYTPTPPPPPPVPAGPAYTGELARVDQLRRTFQLRRFGSGYDPQQVDRLFETVLGSLSGRTGGAVNEGELDPGRLNLVPGGYYEAEVEQALREVRDIVGRR